MVELGIAADAANARPVVGESCSRALGSTRAAASRNVAYDDSSAAAIRNPRRSKDSHLRSEKSSDGTQRSSKVQARQELSTSSLIRIREGVREALAVHANVEPDRVLQLLKDTSR